MRLAPGSSAVWSPFLKVREFIVGVLHEKRVHSIGPLSVSAFASLGDQKNNNRCWPSCSEEEEEKTNPKNGRPRFHLRLSSSHWTLLSQRSR